MPDATTWILLAVALAAGVGATWIVLWYVRQRIVDVPGARSAHTHPVPTAGGLGFVLVFFALAFVATALDVADFEQVTTVVIVALPLGIVGLLDDRVPLPRYSRLPVQIIVAALAVWQFGPLYVPWGGDAESVYVAKFVFTVVGVTAVINFYNFMDGIDGLVASTTAVQLAFLGLWLEQPVWWLMSAALVGFLVWNWSPAKVFMGDVGSTVLGAVAAMAVIGHDASPVWRWYLPIVCLPVVGDAVYTIGRRALRGENVILAHNSHIYQRLVRGGWSQARTALAYVLLTITLGALTERFALEGAYVGAGLFVASVVGAELFIARRHVPFAAS